MHCRAHPTRLAALPMAAAVAFAAVVSCLALPARAATAWLCSLSDDAVRLVCVADVDPLDEPAPALVTPTATATVKGTRFPLDPRRVYSVDLWSPPTEPEWVELLARSTICYRSPGCTVTMAPYNGLVAAAPRPRTTATR